tara:strand:- start:49 stop:1179 length:1131 start_codon:yes stop_codon:yes gene_type:complete
MKKIILIFFCFLLNSTSYGEHNSIQYDLPWFPKYEVKGSDQYYKFNSNLTEDEIVKKEIKNYKKTGLISYLLYEDGVIVIDEKSQEDWLTSDKWLSEEKRLLVSHSVGKSFASYITGHAICEGYIDSVDVVLDDWSILNNTLYHGQKLIDILNMTTGDQKYVGTKICQKDDELCGQKGTTVVTTNIQAMMEKNFQNTKKSKSVYNYSALATGVFLNYTIYKVGEDYQKLLNKIFNEYVKVKNNIYFMRTGTDETVGSGRYTTYATRYDYLRIAKTILEDWNNDTCVGKYLKTIYERRINKNRDKFKSTAIEFYTKKYGGQFHFDVVGLTERKILGMGGAGGQQVIIDLDRGRIIVVNARDRHYNWKKIVLKKLKQK